MLVPETSSSMPTVNRASRLFAGEFVEHAGDHGRGELLRRQPVASAAYPSAAVTARPLPYASVRAATTSRYSGSPSDPGSFVRSSTADRAHGVRQRRQAARRAGNGRYSRTCTTPTRSPACSQMRRRSRRRSARRNPSASAPARPADARCSRRCACHGRCGRPASPSSPPPPRAPGRKTGLPSPGPGSRCRGFVRCRG